MTIKEICQEFQIGGEYVSCEEVPTGHINGTFLVHFIRDGEKKHYIVQHINRQVFKVPEDVMENIINVTHHVRQNVRKSGLSTKRFVLRAFKTKEDKPYVIDENGEYWRCYRYIANSTTYDTTEDLSIIERVGQAFGRFQQFLSDYQADTLNITIPDFHNTKKRYDTFKEAIKLDPKRRVKNVTKEIEELLSFEEKATELQSYLDRGEIPLRVTHNDTKCNNVSFDKTTGEALAVLDLDTVMCGAVAHDFGDAIRFVTNTLPEDNPDVNNVKMDVEKYTAFAKGFLGELKGTLTDLEFNSLNLGAFAMTVEVAVRFLTDYILGDVYFKTKYPGHNLDRARNQTALAKDMLLKMDAMDNILQQFK